MNDRQNQIATAKTSWLWLLALLLTTTEITGQEGGITQDILAKAQIAVSPSHVKHPLGIVQWSDSTGNMDLWKRPDREMAYWIRLDPAVIPDEGYLSVPGQAAVTLWSVGQGDTLAWKFGFSRAMHKLPVRGVSDVMGLDMLPAQTRELILRITPFTQKPYPIRVSYVDTMTYAQSRQKAQADRPGYYLFLGAGVLSLLFLAGFALFQFFENRRRAYMYYGLYMVCMALYFLRILEYHYEVPVLWGYFFEGYGLAEIVALMLSYAMYVLFVRHFLSFDAKRPRLLVFVRIWIVTCLIISAIGLILSLLHVSSPAFLQVYLLVRFLMPLFVLYFLWRIHRAQLEFSRYVITGSLMLLLGGLLALMATFLLNSYHHLLSESMFYMLSGVLLESFVFALGLGKQARKTELEKIATQDQLILQLQKEAQLERDIRESQVQTLRAQMNPHFIFNALNSIQHFVLSNDKETAVKYLSRVSQLIRRILQNSTAPSISIDEELQTLEAYIGLEQLRFHPAFTYTCTTDEDIDTGFQRIPHLMIQPFIENAILHGLVHRQEPGGVLTLELHARNEQSIEVVITDNGIGRAEAARIAEKNPRKHKSISMGSIEARIRLLLPEEMYPVFIEDLKDEIGVAQGTRVRLFIPIV